MKNLKFYLGSLALIAALGGSNISTLSVLAEEEVLFQQENNGESTQTPVEVENGKNETPETQNGETQNGETQIDKDDEEYNTGRTEIPDYVKTEKERKFGKDKDHDDDDDDKEEEKETQTTPKTGSAVEYYAMLYALGLGLGAAKELGSEIIEDKKKRR